MTVHVYNIDKERLRVHVEQQTSSKYDDTQLHATRQLAFELAAQLEEVIDQWGEDYYAQVWSEDNKVLVGFEDLDLSDMEEDEQNRLLEMLEEALGG